MDRYYDVYLDNRIIGSVTTAQQGLFCYLSCRCSLPDDKMYKLFAQIKEEILDFGLLYPINDSFGINTKAPLRKLGQGSIRFFVSPKDGIEVCVPLNSPSAFPHLSQLEQCRFIMKNGKPYMRIINEKNG